MIYKQLSIINVKFLTLFITLFLISCTVIQEKPSNYMVLANIESISVEYLELEALIVVDISTQKLFFLKTQRVFYRYYY